MNMMKGPAWLRRREEKGAGGSRREEGEKDKGGGCVVVVAASHPCQRRLSADDNAPALTTARDLRAAQNV